VSEFNDTLAVLLISAGFLHGLTLLGMALHTVLAADQPKQPLAQERLFTALFLGCAPVQCTERSMFISRLLAVSGLLFASASVMSLIKAAPPVWTVILTVIAITELASAYAWHKRAGVNTVSAVELQPDDGSGRVTDVADSDKENATKDPGGISGAHPIRRQRRPAGPLTRAAKRPRSVPGRIADFLAALTPHLATVRGAGPGAPPRPRRHRTEGTLPVNPANLITTTGDALVASWPDTAPGQGSHDR
jgi:hypothetical protein